MTRHRLSTAFAAVASAGLLALTAACGSAGSATDSKNSDTSSGSKAASLTSSDIFSKLIAAQKDAGSYAFTMKISFGAQGLTSTGEADTSTNPPAVKATLDSGGQKFDIISADGLTYFKGSVFGTDKWLKVDPKDKSGLGATLGQAGGSSDPAATLEVLKDAAKVTKGASTTIDGVDTTAYDVTVDSAALAKANPNFAKLKAMLPKTVKYTIFVDKDNLLRRLSNTIAVQGQKVATQMDFRDYGKDVSVSAPPASETTTKAPAGLGGGAA